MNAISDDSDSDSDPREMLAAFERTHRGMTLADLPIEVTELPPVDGAHAWRFHPRFLTDPGPGPWDGEPDKLQWIDCGTGYDCLIVRAVHHGRLCRYVGLPPSHP